VRGNLLLQDLQYVRRVNLGDVERTDARERVLFQSAEKLRRVLAIGPFGFVLVEIGLSGLGEGECLGGGSGLRSLGPAHRQRIDLVGELLAFDLRPCACLV
jgi:hypothetical protein